MRLSPKGLHTAIVQSPSSIYNRQRKPDLSQQAPWHRAVFSHLAHEGPRFDPREHIFLHPSFLHFLGDFILYLPNQGLGLNNLKVLYLELLLLLLLAQKISKNFVVELIN